MTFVMQGQRMDPNYPLSGVIPEEKEFVEANLCRYNRKIFHQIGMDIVKLHKDENYCSSFLKGGEYSRFCVTAYDSQSPTAGSDS